MENNIQEISAHLKRLSRPLNRNEKNIAIILSAGHGKRIKSETSKMLHKVWGVPTVLRVARAAQNGLETDNQILVVGIKAVDVANVCGTRPNRCFAYQAEQNGTGHAVKIALQELGSKTHDGNIYVFPGDVGLLSEEVVSNFRKAFENSVCDMMVLTSIFRGLPSENYYGRIIRVPEKDAKGEKSPEAGMVIEIKEHKDILALQDEEKYTLTYHGREYAFSKHELIKINEFNTGLFAFKTNALLEKIDHLKEDNVQGELYITDLINIFNQDGLSVGAAATEDENSVLGFNVKSVLKQMENIARDSVYDKLKDIITIADREDFFVADEVVDQILELDKTSGPLDIEIGKGVYVGPNVKLNKGVVFHSGATLEGNIVLGEYVVIDQAVNLSTYDHQVMRIGSNTEIFKGDIIKGNLIIGNNCRIESGVNITGSDEHPTRIGNNVLVKGTSRIFGCTIEDDIFIEHSVLKFCYVERTVRKDGTIQPIQWVLPQPQGLDSIRYK
ncbi:MAG: NTP transferase domain-containing protein [Deferribacteres bacterium]|nr:NTP transferase domain-containing protein [candidate division KSB1 bacterium]MCB9501189.1 NTP transferase domain-containing protein [Deferribacteres bacterium]